MTRADYQGGRVRYLSKRIATAIIATDLMAKAAGGTFVVWPLRLVALGMAHQDRGGCQKETARV